MPRETRTVSATEAKRHLGEMVDWLPDLDVVVNRYGKPGVVMLSCERYERLKPRAEEPIQGLSEADDSEVG